MDCTVHKLVADVAVLAEDHVLFVKYEDTRKYDGEPGWFLPDDYLRHLEHPAEAAKRIVRDQTGLEPPSLELAFIESFDGGAWHLVFHFRGEFGTRREPSYGDNVAAAEWFPVDGLPPDDEVAHGGWCSEVVRKILTASRAGEPARLSHGRRHRR